MNRYFLEVAYKGTRYSGFQVQENANTIQAEIEKALSVFFRKEFHLTGSSRTDAGVHALQNFFHFDEEDELPLKAVYNINSMLPEDIVIKWMKIMQPKADGNFPHVRFDATSREYRYLIHQKKNPFSKDTSYYFPYVLDIELLQRAAVLVKNNTDFTSFSKRNTQVKTFNCVVERSEWNKEQDRLIYEVKANRFLRGMVKALVGTMLQVGRKKISIDEFKKIIVARDCSLADFSAPAQGLFLVAVEYPKNLL